MYKAISHISLQIIQKFADWYEIVFSCEVFPAFESSDIPQRCMPENIFSGIPEDLEQKQDEL